MSPDPQTVPAAAPTDAPTDWPAEAEVELTGDDLVEEISIDGMCGVY